VALAQVAEGVGGLAKGGRGQVRSTTGVTVPASSSSRRAVRSSRVDLEMKKTTFWPARSEARPTLAM
jgi:hypothetical protein